MNRVLPTSFTAGRPITLEGTLYALGATIPTAVVARVRRVNGLLSRRWIIPVVDPYFSRLRKTTPRPVDLTHAELLEVSKLP